MSVPWREVEENPNPTGGCVCYGANNPDQPKCGGWLNSQREFNDLGSGSPHVYLCRGCINIPKGLFDVEIVEPEPKPRTPAKRKAAPATD